MIILVNFATRSLFNSLVLVVFLSAFVLRSLCLCLWSATVSKVQKTVKFSKFYQPILKFEFKLNLTVKF